MRAGFLEGHFFLFFNFLAELNGIWDHNSLTRDETHVLSPSLKGEFFTTGPPQKSQANVNYADGSKGFGVRPCRLCQHNSKKRQ